eukprot:m.62402 g.62402  ORF g.62402 m.62402 type:complete len:593 (-) comp15800_c0_seq2:416-2194(-)
MAKPTSTKQGDKEARSVVGFIPVVLVVIVVVLVTRNHPNASANSATSKKTVSKPAGEKVDQGSLKPDPAEQQDLPATLLPETASAEKQRSQAVQRSARALKSKLAKYWTPDTGATGSADSYRTPALDRAFLYDIFNDTAGLAFMGEKLARAIKYGNPIVVGMVGSSVAAGHDNCQYDSFSSQLQRTLQEVFDPAGIKVEVRNAGQGGGCQDSMENQIFCLRHMLGDDVDFTVYTWTFFESGSGADKLRLLHEAFVRWSLMMERAASPILMYAGGCTDKRDQDTVTPVNQNIFDAYGKYGFNILCMTRGVRELGYVKGKTGVTTSGKRGFWGAVGDGLHNITRYGEKETTPERRYSLGVMFRNWHPGPLAFQAASDAYAMRLLAALDHAFTLLESQATTIRPKPSAISATTLGPNGCHVTERADFWSDEALCDSVPVCANHELPTYGKAQITYAKAKDTANPMHDRFSESVSEWQADPSTLIPREERGMPGCAHYDFCRGFRGDFMTYKVPPLKVGYIVMCFIVGNKADVSGDGKFFLDSKPLVLPGISFSKNKCIVLQERWAKGQQNTDAAHYVSVDLTTLPNPHVSHVFGV